jgi:cell division protein FtsI (penicillin-binding protein 3)
LNRRRKKVDPAIPAWRVRVLLGLFALAAVSLESHLFWLQVVRGDFNRAEGDDRQLRVVEMPAHRGIIEDRFGDPLAVSTPVDRIIVDPQRIPKDREVIYQLAAAVGRDGAEVERDITSRLDRRYYRLQSDLAPAEAAKVIDLGILGVSSERQYRRFYPHHEVTCHLLGFTSGDDAGQEGLELLYDYDLAGVAGSKRVQHDERGRILADIEQIKAPRPGSNLRLSLDSGLQFEAYRALKAAVLESGASSGSLVLLDTRTGEVLAMANQPACNPNDKEQRANLARFRNRAITDPIEPGSSFKPLILAAALANGYTPETLIDVPKNLEVAGKIRTDDPVRLGIATVTEILARSSNVGMGLIGRELDPADIYRTLKAFGIGSSTDSDLGSLESYGALNHYSDWNEVTQASLSFGYGVSVTPLQLARAYAAIASDGLLPPISFTALDRIPKKVRAVSPAVASDLMTMLEAVVASDVGTAKRAAIPHYRVAGKTGTARIFEGPDYSDVRHNAIFAGIAPASRPRFVAVVFVNDPQVQPHNGGDIAAPVFAKVMSAALSRYGVAPDALDDSLKLSQAEVPK